jgi:signal transduction histidine kinase/ActR/RegA family two-component response regulator
MKKALRFIALVIIWALPALSCLAQNNSGTSALAKQGVIDLRKTNLFSQPVSLNGEWRFYWKQLLQPGYNITRSSQFVQYPKLWKNDDTNKNLSSQGYATYTLTVLLPKEYPALALKVPDTYSSYKLFINGKLFSQNGEPGQTKETSTPFWATQVVPLAAPTDTLQLTLQVANFWHSKGGVYKEIVLGDNQQVLLTQNRDTAFDLVLSGCLFMGGLFFFGLFLFAKRDKAILFFSLFCMVYSYRMVGTSLYVLHTVFPSLDWFVTVRLEYLTLILAVGLFSKYTKFLYPKEALHLIMNTVMWCCWIYAALIVFTPPVVFTSLMNPFLVLMFLYIVIAFYVYIQAVRHKRSGSVYALLSSGVMLIVFFIINLQFFNIIPAMKVVVFAGYIAFFFLQSLVLSHRFSETLQHAAVLAQQGLKAKSEFLSTMSHEIRTPLNSVIGMAHLLKRSQPREDQKTNIDVLLFSASNLLSIVNNILDYNKIEEGKIAFESIGMDLPAIARNIVAGLRGMADERRIKLSLDIDNQIKQKVIGDPTRTSQVINNLVHNAIKFTREGSVHVSLRASNLTSDHITITVSVKDSGIGIPKEKQQLIFERFTQADSSISRSYGGTGLGLSISKRILELQGSALHLNSEPGKGSDFFFTQTFSLSRESVDATDVLKAPEENKVLKNVHILLVEDNPMNVLVAKTFLERCGALVDVAVNGEEGLQKFDSQKHRLVLMDLEMPVMDGYEATRQLRKRGEMLPVIALTASLPKEVESDVQSAGFTDIIVKPFDPDDFFRVVLHYLKQDVAA